MSDMGDMMVMGVWILFVQAAILCLLAAGILCGIHYFTGPWDMCASIGNWGGCI